jgi:hypothetical protein
VVLAALTALHSQGLIDAATCAAAIARHELSPDAAASWST